MRYKVKTAVIGDARYVKKFLLFPKCLSNEWRWLEVATWKEIAMYRNNGTTYNYIPTLSDKQTVCFKWVAAKWLYK